MTDFNYKKYSLENLENWLHDAMSSGEASPQEIYDTIQKVVSENYYHHKYYASRAYELMEKLNGSDSFSLSDVLSERDYYEGVDTFNIPRNENKLVCDKDDNSPECQKSWNDFWEGENENQYSPSEVEYVQAKIQANSPYNDGFTREYYQKIVDKYKNKQDKVVRWQLPVEVDGVSGEYFVCFPDDLLEAANLKEGDQIEWVDQGNGSFLLRKVFKPLGIDEC